MGMKSTNVGKKGEALAERFFRERGYWVHLTNRSNSGAQPVDLIAIRGEIPWLLDAKYVSLPKKAFSFDDIQPNQLTTMNYAKNFARIDNLGFFIVFEAEEEKPRYLPYSWYLGLARQGKKSIRMEELKFMMEDVAR